MKKSIKLTLLLVLAMLSNSLSAKKLIINASITDCTCFGSNDGIIHIIVTQGTPPYTYSWSNLDDPLLVNTNNTMLTDLSAGSYSVTITDSNFLTVTRTYVVTEPSQIVINSVVVNESCEGCKDGSVSYSVIGGVEPYQTQIAGPSFNKTTELGAGEYSLCVSDAHACNQCEVFTILTDIPTSNINKEDYKSCRIYPNPVLNSIKIACNEFAISNVKILSSTGSLIKHLKNTNTNVLDINISDYSQGLYIIQVTLINDQLINKKILKL